MEVFDPNAVPHDDFKQLEGYLKQDIFGRVFIDRCATDEEHMNAPTEPGDDRRRCRVYLSSLIPKELLDQNVVLEIDIRITPKEPNVRRDTDQATATDVG